MIVLLLCGSLYIFDVTPAEVWVWLCAVTGGIHARGAAFAEQRAARRAERAAIRQAEREIDEEYDETEDEPLDDSFTSKVPKPSSCTLSPDFNAVCSVSTNAFRAVSQSFLVRPLASAMAVISSVLFIVFRLLHI